MSTIETQKQNTSYKIGLGIYIFASLLLVWVNGAVGIVGAEDNPANRLFYGVLLIGVLGTLLSRLRPKGMARTVSIMAVSQTILGIIIHIRTIFPIADQRTLLWFSDVLMISAFFAILFALSAYFFRRIAQ